MHLLTDIVRRALGIEEAVESTVSSTDEVITNLADLETKLIERDRQTTFEKNVLLILNEDQNGGDKLKSIVRLIHEFAGNDVVGMRIREDGDFPYYYFEGFSDEFIAHENKLCSEGGRLDCMCGAVLEGNSDPSLPFFTKGGSFWSGCTSKLVKTVDEHVKKLGFKTRQRCWKEGYETVVLVPLATGGDIVGLLQLNDKRKRFFSRGDVAFFEQIGRMLGIGIRRMLTEDKLKHSQAHYKTILELVPHMVFRAKLDGLVLEAEGRRELFISPPESQVGRRIHEYLPKSVVKRLLPAMQKAHTTGEPVTCRYKLTHPVDGVQTLEARIVKYAAATDDEILAVVFQAGPKKGG